MPGPDRPVLLRAARVIGVAGLWAMFLGPSLLLVVAWVEVLNRPGISLVDGYWVGREPWTSIGVVPALVGSLAGLLGGGAVLAVEGGWWRRFLLVPALAGAGLWWATALGALPLPDFRAPDPVELAYTLPAAAALLVLMPAALLATLAITPRRIPPPGVGLRPLPPSAGTALVPRRMIADSWDDESDAAG